MHSLWNSACDQCLQDVLLEESKPILSDVHRAPSQTTFEVLHSLLSCHNGIKLEINSSMINRPLESHQHCLGDNWLKRKSEGILEIFLTE